MSGEYCDKHAAHCTRLKSLEKNVDELWNKWDSIQKLFIATLTTLCLNLVGVIIIVIKLFT